MKPSGSNLRAVVLLICVLALAGVGILMLASTGAYATDGTEKDMGNLKKQAIFLAAGLVVCGVASRIDYHLLEKAAPWLVGGAVILLALCYTPWFGVTRNGETRWIGLQSFGIRGAQIQPSEAGKFALVLFMAWWYARHPLRTGEFWKGYLQPWLALGGIVLLVAFEKDLGTAALMGAVVLVVMFTAGVKWIYLLGSVGAGVAGLALMVRLIPERMGRLTAFMDLEAHKLGEGLQQWRALIALGSGGLEGRGFGNGVEKMFYMPYAHTDFIFPMIGEEFGLAGTLAVILLFVMLIMAGMLIAASAPDTFGRVLGAGVIAIIGCQALINLMVTTALLPNKGMPLPFISYGGSNLLTLFFMIGVLMNIHRQGFAIESGRKSVTLADPVITPRL